MYFSNYLFKDLYNKNSCVHFMCQLVDCQLTVSFWVKISIKFIDKHLAIVFHNRVLVIALLVLVIHQLQKCSACNFFWICSSHLIFFISTVHIQLASIEPITSLLFSKFIKVNDGITFLVKMKQKVGLR